MSYPVSNQLRYALLGACLGLGAPLAWISIRILFFLKSGTPLIDQVLGDITASPENSALYVYMGLGTALVMAVLGNYIGRNSDELHSRTQELDTLHAEVAKQKEIFENRYKVLDSNIKKFHQISSRIQKSASKSDIISLCVEGLHSVLGYERVNIFLVDETGKALKLAASSVIRDTSFNDILLPLDERIGIIHICYTDKQIFLVDDINDHPQSYRIKPPYSEMDLIRSKSFILCPIILKGECIGILGIDNKHSQRSLNETDVDTIKLFADLVASALVRSSLISDINKLTANLESTFTDLLANRGNHSQTIKGLMLAMTSLNEGTSTLAAGAEQILASLDTTSDSANHISIAIEHVSSNLDALSDTVYKSASAMEEITTTLNNVKQSAQVSHMVSSQVKQKADMSLGMVKQTISSLDEIQASVSLSHDGIMRLSENSGRIEGIVSVINDITKRTNLLALNASIIAAQAGEYGKSFGVVADEIRNLSLQTGHSTGEITGIINEIMTESHMAAENIKATKQIVVKGVDLGQKTGESLDVIVNSANEAMDMTEEIKLATEEQARSIELVTRSIEDVSAMTNQIFNSSKEQALATRKIATEVDTIKKKTITIVNATNTQLMDAHAIKKAVDQTGELVTTIFNDIEQRSKESALVVKTLAVVNEPS